MDKDSSASVRQQAPQLVRHVNAGKTIRVDVGESLTEALGRLQTSEINADDSGEEASAALVRERIATLEREKIEALAEIICGAGDEAAGALLVLTSTLVSSTDPKALANAAKHFAFTRCGELNLYGMVEAQTVLLEGELLTSR